MAHAYPMGCNVAGAAMPGRRKLVHRPSAAEAMDGIVQSETKAHEHDVHLVRWHVDEVINLFVLAIPFG